MKNLWRTRQGVRLVLAHQPASVSRPSTSLVSRIRYCPIPFPVNLDDTSAVPQNAHPTHGRDQFRFAASRSQVAGSDSTASPQIRSICRCRFRSTRQIPCGILVDSQAPDRFAFRRFGTTLTHPRTCRSVTLTDLPRLKTFERYVSPTCLYLNLCRPLRLAYVVAHGFLKHGLVNREKLRAIIGHSVESRGARSTARPGIP